MDEILKRVHAKFAALSPEALSATLESVADHPIVKVLEAVLHDDECWLEYESFDIFIKSSNFIGGVDYRMQFEEVLKIADFFAANDSNFLLAA